MPTTYTHDRFGAEVLKKLPEKEQKLILRHKNLFEIGLHGPDIFFYYHPMLVHNRVVQYGVDMHDENAASFFLPAAEYVKEVKSEAALVYLLGFTCHFILDSCSHPYINQAEKRPGCSHAGIESEQDRYYMKLDGKDPFSYKPAAHLNPKDPEIKEIVPLFKGIREYQLRASIAGLKNYTGFLVCTFDVKERMILKGMKKAKVYDSLEGHVIRAYPVKECADCVPDLIPLYEKALEEAPLYIHNVCQTALGKEELSCRFEQNYQ